MRTLLQVLGSILGVILSILLIISLVNFLFGTDIQATEIMKSLLEQARGLFRLCHHII